MCQALERDYIAGLTLSGGDPLLASNIPTITNIVAEICMRFPGKNVWIYTGARYEEVQHLPLMRMVDVLVDGEYVEALRDENAPWVGSTNQRVIDVQKSLACGHVILWEAP